MMHDRSGRAEGSLSGPGVLAGSAVFVLCFAAATLGSTTVGQEVRPVQVNIYEAKTCLSECVEHAHAGQTVIVAKGSTPMAKLAPLHEGSREIKAKARRLIEAASR